VECPSSASDPRQVSCCPGATAFCRVDLPDGSGSLRSPPAAMLPASDAGCDTSTSTLDWTCHLGLAAGPKPCAATVAVQVPASTPGYSNSSSETSFHSSDAFANACKGSSFCDAAWRLRRRADRAALCSFRIFSTLSSALPQSAAAAASTGVDAAERPVRGAAATAAAAGHRGGEPSGCRGFRDAL